MISRFILNESMIHLESSSIYKERFSVSTALFLLPLHYVYSIFNTNLIYKENFFKSDQPFTLITAYFFLLTHIISFNKDSCLFFEDNFLNNKDTTDDFNNNLYNGKEGFNRKKDRCNDRLRNEHAIKESIFFLS